MNSLVFKAVKVARVTSSGVRICTDRSRLNGRHAHTEHVHVTQHLDISHCALGECHTNYRTKPKNHACEA